MIKKLISIIMVGLIALMTFSVSTASVHASTVVNEEKENIQVSEKDLAAAEVLMNNLTTFLDENGNKQMKIIDSEYLQSELDVIGYPLQVSELQNSLDQFNEKIISENGNGPITDMTKTAGDISLMKKGSGNCAKALQFIGYVHAGSYAAAAALLGITGATSVIVPLVIGLIYQAGSLLC